MEKQEYLFIDSTNELFFHCAHILIRMLDKGPISLSNYINENNLNGDIYIFLQKGLLLINEGKDPNQLRLRMKCEKCKWIRDLSKSENDLQLITIIQHILLLIQHCQILSFLRIASEFVHRKNSDYLYDLFEKYDYM
ncbi:MAG: hypothetical protein F8N39_19030, partial [Clostridiaceae bacterium]|nr:hypothetical protein [Clostridiaceae bacterium]